MIKISEATRDDLDEWRSKEWHKVDVAHYGRDVEWNEQKFKFKAVENGKLLGYISGKHESGIIYIGTIITAEGQRGKGIGSLLINKAEEFGKKLGAHKIWLITGKNWSENAFYQKGGFKKAGDLPDFHYHTDFVIYTKPIIPPAR